MAQTSVTIYSDGRLLVRRTIPAAIARGSSTLAADLGVREVEAGSIVSLDSAVQISGMRVFGAVGLDGSLRRSLGTDVTFRTGPDSAPRYVRGTVLSVDPPAVRVDGWVMYSWPGTPVFPDSLVQLTPRYDLSIESSRQASSLKLLYLSSGLAWSASYAVMLPRGGAGRASVTGSAQIANTGAVTLTGAKVQLLSGDVRLARQPRPMLMSAQRGAIALDGGPTQEAVGGSHVYSLPGTIDFVSGETRVIALFPSVVADVVRDLRLQAAGYGMNGQWPETQRDQHPEIGYVVKRPPSSAFGALPLPAGTVRFFEPDSAGQPQLVGEASIEHTPAGRDIRVTTGTEFDVTAQRAQTEFTQRGQRESESAYHVEVQSAKTQAVSVFVMDQCPGSCEVLSSSVPAEHGSPSAIGFRVTVPANGSVTLDYRVRARW